MTTVPSAIALVTMAKISGVYRHKLIYLWAFVAVAVIVAIAVGVWATNRDNPPKGTKTVGEAVAGGVVQEDMPAQVNGDIKADDSTDANRVTSLAKALGIPLNSVPRDITQTENGKSDVRVYLERELNSAVEAGDISESDEKAVLVAFERGLVMPASDGIVAESYPAN